MAKLEVGDHFLTTRQGQMPVIDGPGQLEFEVLEITALTSLDGKVVLQVKIKEIQ